MRRASWLGLVLAVFCGSEAGRTEESAGPLEAILRGAGLKTDDAALLDFFRGRTLSDKERTRLEGLVRQLGADSFAARQQASEALVKAGRIALPMLRAGTSDSDLEIARRARRCLQDLEARPETEQVRAAAALLALRRPAGSAAVLLAYLPFLEEEASAEDLFRAVQAAGWRDGKLEPALLAAVTSKLAIQRSAAGWVLGRSKAREDRSRILPLLRDADARVRWQAAEGLTGGRDERGIPALVALLEKGPLDLASQAESVLATLAGDRTPMVSLGTDETQRGLCHKAWQEWYRTHGAKLDLAKLDLTHRPLGLRLVVAHSGFGGQGAVWEYGADHKTRWEIRNVGGPFDACVLPGGRVLVIEYNGRKVSERDRSGKVLWEHRLPNGPLEAYRLPNGNTLIATNHEIREVTRAGTITFQYRGGGGNIFSAQKLPGGNILMGLYTGHIVELDRTGKELRRFGIERPSGLASIVLLPGGRILMPYARSNRIVEMDRDGTVRRQVSVPGPTCVDVLPGGTYLVGSHLNNTVKEIDATGKVLWERRMEGQIFRVRVR